jgi:hypothetical protein
LQVAFFDGKSQLLALLSAALLKRRGGAKGGVEGDVVELIAGRARFDITPMRSLRFCERTPAGLFAS